MSAETKRREILQMLAKGSIDANEASELLLQIKENEPQAPVEPASPPEAPAPSSVPSPPPPPKSGKKARWLNVQVTDTDSGKNRVSVKIPLGLARMGLRMGAKFAPEVDDLDWEEILDQISEAGQTIVEVHDESEGEQVHIFVN